MAAGAGGPSGSAPIRLLALPFCRKGQCDNEWKVSYGLLASCLQLRRWRSEGGNLRSSFHGRSPTHTRTRAHATLERDLDRGGGGGSHGRREGDISSTASPA